MLEQEARLRGDRDEAARTVRDLEAELAGIVDQQVAVAPDDEHDAEGSTIGFERARVTALLAHARQVLADLDQAQARMAAGSYGLCDGCGGAIPDERLVARPTASTCVRCAARAAGPGGDRGLGRGRP
jgi:RNA polymerase-binding transcription factor DksA